MSAGSNVFDTRTLFVERFPELLTGWPMLGIGADWAMPTDGDLILRVTYDGATRLDVRIAPHASGYRFGYQILIESHAKQLSVIVFGERILAVYYHGPLAEVPWRRASVASVPGGPRWLSPIRTFAGAITSGQVLTSIWWSQRIERYRNKLVRLRQKVRDKYQLKVHSLSRSHYAAMRDAMLPSAEALQEMTRQAASFRYQPTISILVPVYNVEPRWLNRAVASVLAQSYPHWELCLADDASTDPETLSALSKLPQDPRIKLVRRAENGHICAATNSAAELAMGEFVAFMDNDDELAPQALFRIVEALQTHTTADILYSDEDKNNEHGEHFDPFFKPDWSPELFLCFNYINHLTVMRRSLFEKVGRFRIGYHGAQDYDLLLRATEATDRIVHVPEILYPWRAIATSSAANAEGKPMIHDAVERGLRDALVRRGIPVTITTPEFAKKLGLPIHAFDGPDTGPTVAIIVYGPRDAANRTVQSLKRNMAYQNATTFLVLDPKGIAESLNQTAASRTEDFLLFLEAGLEATEPRWLSRWMASAQLPGVAASGGILMHGETIIRAGTVLTDRPRDGFHGVTPNPVSYFFLAEAMRNVVAPSRGLLLTPRHLFDMHGGFDATRYPTSLWDVEFCLRAGRSIHLGQVKFTTTDPEPRQDSPVEQAQLRKLSTYADPYHSRHLDPHEPFTLPTAKLPAVAKPRKRVLFASHNMSPFEGAPKILADIAIGMHAKQAREAVIFAPKPGGLRARFESVGIPCHTDDKPYALRLLDAQWTPRDYEACIRDVQQVLRTTAPDVVVVNTLGMFPVVEAAARLGLPVQWLIHESYTQGVFESLLPPFARQRCERAMLLAERVIFGSRGCADLYRRLDGRKNFTHIHYGLDRTPLLECQQQLTRDEAVRKLGGHPETPRFLAVGTVCERKAQHTLVEAAAIVAKTRRDFRCLLVGARPGIPYRDYVEALITSYGLQDIVELVAETDSVPTYFRSADVFVCTSYVEAFSLSILEAEAFGLPILSTPCIGLAEQVVWHHNALRFGLGRADELAAGMLKLLENPALRQRMGQESRAMSETHLRPDEMIERFSASILRTPSPPGKGNLR
ncbi:MAG: glycosyltransferase [Fimbriiglobus sp.]